MASTMSLEPEAPSPSQRAQIEALENLNGTLRQHVAWLSSELARVSASEASVRARLGEVSGWLGKEAGIQPDQVGSLRERMERACDEAHRERARARAGEEALARAEEALAKREDQVLALSAQLGRAAGHLKDVAQQVAGWGSRHRRPEEEMPLDLTEAKFETQRRLIADLSQRLAERDAEMAAMRTAVDVWEARHNVWEATCLEPGAAGFVGRAARGSSGREKANGRAPEPTRTDSQRSLHEAEQAWRARCEQLRRAREQPPLGPVAGEGQGDEAET